MHVCMCAARLIAHGPPACMYNRSGAVDKRGLRLYFDAACLWSLLCVAPGRDDWWRSRVLRGVASGRDDWWIYVGSTLVLWHDSTRWSRCRMALSSQQYQEHELLEAMQMHCRCRSHQSRRVGAVPWAYQVVDATAILHRFFRTLGFVAKQKSIYPMCWKFKTWEINSNLMYGTDLSGVEPPGEEILIASEVGHCGTDGRT